MVHIVLIYFELTAVNENNLITLYCQCQGYFSLIFFFFQLFFLMGLGYWFISHLNLRFCFLKQVNRELVQTLYVIWCMVCCQSTTWNMIVRKKAPSIKKQRKLLCSNSTKQLPKFLIWGISIKVLRPRSKIFSKHHIKTFDSKILQRSTVWLSSQLSGMPARELANPSDKAGNRENKPSGKPPGFPHKPLVSIKNTPIQFFVLRWNYSGADRISGDVYCRPEHI